MSKLYCYCISKIDEDKKIEILENKKWIKYKNLAFLCEKLDGDTKASKDSILRHDEIIRKAFQSTDVIPISYGTLVNSAKEIETFLMKNYFKITKILKKIENKIEVNLKLIWKKDSFDNEVNNEEILKYKEEMLGEKGEVADADMIEFGQIVQERVEELRKMYENEIFDRLQEEAVEGKINEAVTPRMILNLSFLVDKSKEKKFDLEVNKFYEKYKDTINFKYTGPFPPYNFINEKFSVI